VRSGSLRFAAIGCGDIGYKNARALAEAANAELVYAHDPVERLAEVTVEQFGGEVARSVEDALDPRRVDAVVLSVPHDLHAPLIERAAAAGIHVVVEKPLAQDLPTARRAAEVAERAGVALALLMPYRFSTDLRRARELVQAGALGDPLGAAIVFHDDQPDAYWGGGFSGRAASSWRLERARSGGGVLIMSLIHYLDFVRHVLGLDVTSVAATGLIRPGFEVEDAVAMTARFENGAVATILGSTSTRGRPPVNVEMWGEAGTILLQPHARIFTERAVDGVVANRWCELPPDDPRDIRARYIEAFVSAVLDGRAPEVSVADALALQAIIEAGYRSMDLGHPVELHDVVGERA
jgi:predicted dehydrogenase